MAECSQVSSESIKDDLKKVVKRKAILVLMGLPASGKTTLSTVLAKSLTEFHVHVVTYDQEVSLEKQKELVDKATSNEDEQVWKRERKAILAKVDQYLISDSDNKEDKDLVVVIDDNNYYSSMRYEYHQLARKHEIGFCQLFLDLDLDRAKDVNSKRGEKEQVPEEVLDRMAAKMEAPNPLSNSWEQFSFVLKQNDDNIVKPEDTAIDMCRTVIALAMDNPVKAIPDNTEERDLSRSKCTASVVHQADKILRKTLNAKIRAAKQGDISKEAMEKKAKELNAMRTEVMEDLKTGFTTLPKDVVQAVESKKDGATASLEPVIQELFELKLSSLSSEQSK